MEKDYIYQEVTKLVLINYSFLTGCPNEEGGNNDDEFQHEVEIPGPSMVGLYAAMGEQYERLMDEAKPPNLVVAQCHNAPPSGTWHETSLPCETVDPTGLATDTKHRVQQQ